MLEICKLLTFVITEQALKTATIDMTPQVKTDKYVVWASKKATSMRMLLTAFVLLVALPAWSVELYVDYEEGDRRYIFDNYGSVILTRHTKSDTEITMLETLLEHACCTSLTYISSPNPLPT